MTVTPSIAVEFTVTRTYRAYLNPRDFPNLPTPGTPQSDDAVAGAVQRWLEARWVDRSQLADLYAGDDNWDGDDPEVEIEDVEIIR